MGKSQGDALKQEGMERAGRAADPEWWAFMKKAGIDVARRQEYFLSDDLARVKRIKGGPSTHEDRAIGPLMRELARDGVCEPTDRFIMSSQPQNHRRPMRVWKSLICLSKRPKPSSVQVL